MQNIDWSSGRHQEEKGKKREWVKGEKRENEHFCCLVLLGLCHFLEKEEKMRLTIEMTQLCNQEIGLISHFQSQSVCQTQTGFDFLDFLLNGAHPSSQSARK